VGRVAARAQPDRVGTGDGSTPPFRPIDEQSLTFGPARAWKVTTDRSVVPGTPPTYYQLTELGCAALQPRPGDFLFALQDVPTPPDGVGLLTIG